MFRRHRVLGLLLCVILLSAARPSLAALPSPPNCSVEPILVGGNTGNLLPGPGGPGFQVVVRDMFNLPIGGVTVDIQVPSAALRLYRTQAPGTMVFCGQHFLRKTTNPLGEATFAPCIGGFDNSNAASIFADGILLAIVPVRSTDINASQANTDLGDLNLFRVQFYAPQPAAPQTDYTGDGVTGLADLNIFRGEFVALMPGNYCP